MKCKIISAALENQTSLRVWSCPFRFQRIPADWRRVQAGHENRGGGGRVRTGATDSSGLKQTGQEDRTVKERAALQTAGKPPGRNKLWRECLMEKSLEAYILDNGMSFFFFTFPKKGLRFKFLYFTLKVKTHLPHQCNTSPVWLQWYRIISIS